MIAAYNQGVGMRARNLWAGVALALAMPVGWAQTPLPDQLGYVNDLAGAMSSDAASRLGGVLSNYGTASGVQIAVLTVENPVEESPEDLAGRALEIFLQGDSAQRGAMLVWTANGHIIVYVGEGLRGDITDAESQAIIDETVIPAAAAGNVDDALTLGAYRLIEATNDGATNEGAGEGESEPAASQPALPADAPPIVMPQQAAESLGQDLRILASALVDDPLTALSWLFASAQTQAQALPATLAAQMPLLLSAGDAIVFLGIALAVLGFLLNSVWRTTRSLPGVACALLMGGATVIWLLTRFTELSLLLLLAGPVGLIAWFKWGRKAGASAATPAAAPQNAYATWLVQQQAKQAGRPTTQAPPVAAAAQKQKANAQAKAAASAVPTAPQSPSARRLTEMLERAHASGTATPAFDRVLARWRTITSAQYKQQRTGMLVILVVLGVFFLPLAFLAAAAWVFSELNALKQPDQKLGEFFQQLSREAQAMQRHQSRR